MYSWKFSPGAIFSPVFIEDMATITIVAKINSMKYSCNTKVAGLGEIFGYTVYWI